MPKKRLVKVAELLATLGSLFKVGGRQCRQVAGYGRFGLGGTLSLGFFGGARGSSYPRLGVFFLAAVYVGSDDSENGSPLLRHIGYGAVG